MKRDSRRSNNKIPIETIQCLADADWHEERRESVGDACYKSWSMLSEVLEKVTDSEWKSIIKRKTKRKENESLTECPVVNK